MSYGMMIPQLEPEPPIAIVGTSDFAEIVHDMLLRDGRTVLAVTDREEYLDDAETVFGTMAIPFDDVETHAPPDVADLFVAVAYREGNRVRERFFNEGIEKGYTMASFISPATYIHATAGFGDNCFVFEGNVIQNDVTIGSDTILWSGNHIGHGSVIGEHTFIASHAVISGHCRIGNRCFIGVNATIADGVTIGDDCLIGAGAVVLDDVEPNTVLGVEQTPSKPYSASEYWGTDDD